jgi:integrase
MRIKLRDGTGMREYKFLCEDLDRHGNPRIYLRRKGQPKIRLRAQVGTDDFEREYQAALNGSTAITAPTEKRSTKADTFGWLVVTYYDSQPFQQLQPDTRRVRRRILDDICTEFGDLPFAFGDLPFAAMEPRHIAKLRDAKMATPEAANARVKALRQLFKWAADPQYGYAHRNPARDVSYLAPNNPDGHHTWTREEIAQYHARWPIGSKARLALDLFLYTGVRISDVIKLGPQLERVHAGDARKWLHFTESKGEGRAPKHRQIPVLGILRGTLDATPSGHLNYLVTEFGKPYASAKAFGNRFKSWCTMAGLPHCSAHGMRKGAAVIAAENGATHDDMKAIFGWTTSKQVDLYTRQAQRNKLAGKAMALISLTVESEAGTPTAAEQKSDKSVPLFPAVVSGGTLSAKKA